MMQVPGLPKKRSVRLRARRVIRGLAHRRPVSGAVLDPTWRSPLHASAQDTAEFPAIVTEPAATSFSALATSVAQAPGTNDAESDGDAASGVATATLAPEPGLRRRLRLPRPGSGGRGDDVSDAPIRPIDRSFDLLSRERSRGSLPRLRPRPIEIGAAAALVLALVVIAAGQQSAEGQLATARADDAALGDRLAALEQQLAGSGAVDPGQRLVAEETLARASALNTALTGRIPWDLTLTDLAKVVPSGAWLTSLATAEPEAEGDAPTLVVSGFAREQANVVDVLARLEVLREVAAVRLQSSSATLIDDTPVVQFTVEVEVEAA